MHLPVDCVLGHWQSWGACNACGGERTRRRQVVTFPRNGGMECPKAEPWPLTRVSRSNRPFRLVFKAHVNVYKAMQGHILLLFLFRSLRFS